MVVRKEMQKENIEQFLINLRILLVLLGLIWGGQVIYSFGYYNIFSSDMGSRFYWAIGLSTPFFLGALFVGENELLPRILIGLSVLALALVSVIHLPYTALRWPEKLLIPPIGILLLLWPGFRARYGKGWRGFRFLLIPFFLLMLLYLYVDRDVTIFFNPLPSDEKMITHFQTHRAEFETLVKDFQLYTYYPERISFKSIPENSVRIKKTAILSLQKRGLWFPNTKVAWQYDMLLNKIKQRQIANNKLIRDRKRKRLDLLNENKSKFPYERYKGIVLTMMQTRSFSRPVLRWVGLRQASKQYMYIPHNGATEDGLLRQIEFNGSDSLTYSIYDSLTSYPFFWATGECVFRQIEPQWFIRMCLRSI